MIMNEYERHYWRIMVDLALTRAPSEIVPTIWKYTKKVMLYMCDESLFDEKQAPFGYFRNINFGVAIKGIQFYTTYPEFPYVEAAMKHLEEYQEELLKCNDFQKYVKYMKKWEDTPKYVFDINEALIQIGSSLYKCKKIIANKDIPTYDFYNGRQLIKKGTPGGCIESEKNLSHTGFCWIDENSCVLENARLEGNSFLISSQLYGNATVKGNNTIVYSTICQNASIEGSNSIQKSRIRGDSKIQDNSTIFESNIYDEVEIFGRNDIRFCNIFENIWIENAILKRVFLEGNQKITGRMQKGE